MTPLPVSWIHRETLCCSPLCQLCTSALYKYLCTHPCMFHALLGCGLTSTVAGGQRHDLHAPKASRIAWLTDKGCKSLCDRTKHCHTEPHPTLCSDIDCNCFVGQLSSRARSWCHTLLVLLTKANAPTTGKCTANLPADCRLIVQTWHKNKKATLRPQCKRAPYTYNVLGVSLDDGAVEWENTADHAKWAISTDNDKNIVCVGDINRDESQRCKGGMAACIVRWVGGALHGPQVVQHCAVHIYTCIVAASMSRHGMVTRTV